jgi:hypothetical protein
MDDEFHDLESPYGNWNQDLGEERLYPFTKAGTSLQGWFPKERSVTISHKKGLKTRIISGRRTQEIFCPIFVIAEQLTGLGSEKYA